MTFHFDNTSTAMMLTDYEGQTAVYALDTDDTSLADALSLTVSGMSVQCAAIRLRDAGYILTQWE